ncbi:hypothetical protein PHLCEN_2v4218 [Hermanssonia centrifuga]|uniref:Uncharacterized protein n=1 Tax=Hermanssonia centrifuga TaxID=98765 RepID=A0A2R6PZ01_9APHY|nr:hypothetical protein PHLCEN_2v4218 [Hermanssonia centrifuga]
MNLGGLATTSYPVDIPLYQHQDVEHPWTSSILGSLIRQSARSPEPGANDEWLGNSG